MFIFLLALGEDYNILVMTRIREEAHKLPLREAVVKAIGVTGTTVTSAGLVLAGTFVVFGVVAGSGAGGSQFRDIAISLALGILMDTFLVRTLLVPSTVVLLGRWNWWPSKLTMDRPEVPAPAAGTAVAGSAGPAGRSLPPRRSQNRAERRPGAAGRPRSWPATTTVTVLPNRGCPAASSAALPRTSPGQALPGGCPGPCAGGAGPWP